MGAPLAPRSDTDLLVAARAGDQAALGELIARHQLRVYRFGMKMCRDPEDAQDVLQETLLAMARGIREFRGAASISTWLYSIARSFCIKKRRRGKFDPAPTAMETTGTLDAERVPDPSRRPDDALASKQAEQALEPAIGGRDPNATVTD